MIDIFLNKQGGPKRSVLYSAKIESYRTLSLFGADNMGGPRDTRMGRATYIDRSDGLWFRNCVFVIKDWPSRIHAVKNTWRTVANKPLAGTFIA